MTLTLPAEQVAKNNGEPSAQTGATCSLRALAVVGLKQLCGSLGVTHRERLFAALAPSQAVAPCKLTESELCMLMPPGSGLYINERLIPKAWLQLFV